MYLVSNENYFIGLIKILSQISKFLFDVRTTMGGLNKAVLAGTLDADGMGLNLGVCELSVNLYQWLYYSCVVLA